MTRQERADRILGAVDELPAALDAAWTAECRSSDVDALAAWEAVEKLGATVHRQARLLAGKSKGG